MKDFEPPVGSVAAAAAVPAAAGPLTRKLGTFVPLAEAEIAFLKGWESTGVRVAARTDLVVQGETFGRMFLLRGGWAMRHKMLADGQRQVLNFVLPGDFIGLHASLFPVADHAVTTLTEVTVAEFPPEQMLRLFQTFPRLAVAVAWTGAREEAVIAEHLASVGRRSAYQRMAHLFVELLLRLRAVGQAGDRQFVLPVTQQVLADAMGLSIVHVNRTIRRLRAAGLIRINAQEITVCDLDGLERAADFDRRFLHVTRAPRRTERQLSQMAPTGRS